MSLSILIQVTHLLGAGHLTRSAALAYACAARGHKVTLLSGGMPNALARRAGFETIQLPPVRIAGTAFTKLLTPEGMPAGEVHMAQRREDALAAAARCRPDVLVTELFPFGRRVLAGEFLAVVEAVRAQGKPVAVLASVRDILATPSRIGRIAETEQRLDTLYDGVLVHGDPALVPLEASWPVSPRLAAQLHYTGYIDNPAPAGSAPAGEAADIVVSGGSSAASLPLYRAALEAAKSVPRPWHVLVGNGVEAADFQALIAAAPRNAVVERARPDFRNLLGRAVLSISQCGYNTALDVLGPPLRRLFVPFEGEHETEQRLRAETLAAHGAAQVLRECDLAAATLAVTVAHMLEAPAPAPTPLRRDGAEASAEIIETLARPIRQ